MLYRRCPAFEPNRMVREGTSDRTNSFSNASFARFLWATILWKNAKTKKKQRHLLRIFRLAITKNREKIADSSTNSIRNLSTRLSRTMTVLSAMHFHFSCSLFISDYTYLCSICFALTKL